MRKARSGTPGGDPGDSINLRRHQPRPEDLGLAALERRFEVPRQPAMEEVIGQKDAEQESLDGVGLMLIDVIRVPAVDQLVEALVLDIPSRMAPIPEERHTITRRDVILGAANKDGGAHVDPKFTPGYKLLTDGVWTRRVYQGGVAVASARIGNSQFPFIRQMAFEVLNSPELLTLGDS